MIFGLLAQTLPKKANVQGVGTFIYLLCALTSGFVIYPLAIPSYLHWLFWINPSEWQRAIVALKVVIVFIVLVFFSLVAWAQQGMATNQFKSSKFSGYYCDIGGGTYSLAEISLNARGWSSNMSLWEPFAFLVPFTLVFGVFTWLALKLIRIEPDRQHVKKTVNIGSIKETEELSIPFTPADISFENLVYEVTASTASDTLRLLNEVSGVFRAGRMCALMGSSGGMIWLLFRTSFDLSQATVYVCILLTVYDVQ